MRRHFAIPSLFAAVVAGTALYANVLAADSVYSSENPQSSVQQMHKASSPASSNAAQPKQQTQPVQTATTKTASPRPTPSRSATISGNSLTIPSIGLQVATTEVGVTATNNIDVPSDLRVGRWVGSAKPGTPGAVFLDGHVDGVFANLHSVKTGQVISVSYGGKIFMYRIVHTETVLLENVDMSKALSVYGGAVEGLNIMTCAGTYVSSQGTYDHRFVVYAVRLS